MCPFDCWFFGLAGPGAASDCNRAVGRGCCGGVLGAGRRAIANSWLACVGRRGQHATRTGGAKRMPADSCGFTMAGPCPAAWGRSRRRQRSPLSIVA